MDEREMRDRIGHLARLRSTLVQRWLCERGELDEAQSRAVFALLRDARVEQEALQRQVDWHRRGSGWSWPREPAWTD